MRNSHNVQESNETIEDFAREVRILASGAFTEIEINIPETLMIKSFLDGLRKRLSERLIVKRPQHGLTRSISPDAVRWPLELRMGPRQGQQLQQLHLTSSLSPHINNISSNIK